MSLSLNSERAVVALMILLLSIALFVTASRFPASDTGSAFDPGFFPRIVLGCLIGLAALNLLTDLRSKTGWALDGLRPVILMMAILVVYMLVMPYLGFFAASLVLSVVFLMLLGVRSPVAIAAMATGVPGALVMLFNHILKMPLPTSPLFWWI